MASDVKPNAMFLGGSLVTLAACLGMISLALSAFVVADPCTAIGGAILLLPSVFLGVQQYRAIFRRP